MTTSHPHYTGAVKARREQMRMAREAMDCYQRTLDPVCIDAARIHVKTARAFNRHAWRAKAKHK